AVFERRLSADRRSRRRHGRVVPCSLWYPTRAAPAPLFVTGSLSACRLPAMLCRLIAFEMQVANNARPVDGKFGFIVISHGAGGLSVNHRGLAVALPRGAGTYPHSTVRAGPVHGGLETGEVCQTCILRSNRMRRA